MADQRGGGIAWTEESWNPIRGCSRISEGCRHCYAERVAGRFSGPGEPYEGLAERTKNGPRWTGKVEVVEAHMLDPLRWRRPRRVFVNSMSDLFHESLDGPTIAAVFAVMSLAPEHTFQVLTKRAERLAHVLDDGAFVNEVDDMRERLRPGSGGARSWPLQNVWVGVSCEDQATYDRRVPALLKAPAAVRWISAEPLLGPIDLRFRGQTPACDRCSVGVMDAENPHVPGACWCACHGPRLDWIVVGGESGPGARPMHEAWARTIVSGAQAAGVAVFVKQMGAKVLGRNCEHGRRGEACSYQHKKGGDPAEWPPELRVREYPAPTWSAP
jgi:protein gp37